LFLSDGTVAVWVNLPPSGTDQRATVALINSSEANTKKEPSGDGRRGVAGRADGGPGGAVRALAIVLLGFTSWSAQAVPVLYALTFEVEHIFPDYPSDSRVTIGDRYRGPGTLALFGLGLVGLGFACRRRR
jgi:PEP-CTERM motif